MDFSRLQYQERFEELCKQLLIKLYPQLRTVDGRGGDQGTDSFLGNIYNQTHVFQFKFFPDKLTRNRWQKIEESLKTSYGKNKPSKWVLLLPTDFTVNDWKKWENLKQQYSDIDLDVWLAPKLQSLIMADNSLVVEFRELFPDVETAFKLLELYKEGERKQLELTHPSGSTLISKESNPSIFKIYSNNILNLKNDEREKIEKCIREFNLMMESIDQSGVKITKLDVKSVSILANYYNNAGDYDRSLFLYDLILREYRDDLLSLNNKATIFFAKQDYQQAVDIVELALKIYPDYYDAKLNRGAALVELGKPKDGVEILETLYREKPEDEILLGNLVLGYSRLGNLEKTEHYYEKAKKIVSDDENLISILANAYFNAHKYDKAIELFDNILRKNPVNTKAKNNKAVALVESGFNRIATSLLENIVKQEPNNFTAMTNLAYANIRRGIYDLAIVWGLKALKINENDCEILNTIGVSYANFGDYEEAISYYDRALRTKSDYIDALGNKSQALVVLGKLEDAVSCMDDYLKYDPTDPVILHNKKEALRRLKSKEYSNI